MIIDFTLSKQVSSTFLCVWVPLVIYTDEETNKVEMTSLLRQLGRRLFAVQEAAGSAAFDLSANLDSHVGGQETRPMMDTSCDQYLKCVLDRACQEHFYSNEASIEARRHSEGSSAMLVSGSHSDIVKIVQSLPVIGIKPPTFFFYRRLVVSLHLPPTHPCPVGSFFLATPWPSTPLAAPTGQSDATSGGGSSGHLGVGQGRGCRIVTS